MNLRWLAAVLVLAATASGASPLAPPPGNSVYRSDIKFTDDHAQGFAWGDKRGRPQIVSMFYTSCKFACPMLIDAVRGVEQALGSDERARVGVTLVTLDPVRDTPVALARMRKERGLDAQWTLARPEPRDVRIVASLLGVRYRALADGDFNHTNVLVLLDSEGRIIARTERVGGYPDPAFVIAVRESLRPGS
jgi:protein SCO1/2